ncbi:nucleoside-diphosphate-sugar epimerase [Paucimonas lemoignei]|uniref:Nucleoside-diphosphate-sugar epimerase n=1 Tax=Paucimonas lemoignei TaxID=29443 RepID=A0A4R3HR43_PAULE|nr:SDR family oxidoreductase [Paucimonas lemoignei]TCS35110.1 nucleoside-diphosphate-sugar epimerase [Paucimonas lemoignei]
MSKFSILITGANGFVGQALVHRLQQEPAIRIRKALRSTPASTDDTVGIGDIGPNTDWTKALVGIDAVIHCAARVHVMHDAGSAESLERFRQVNVEGTRRLALQAAAAGVRRLVLVSSVKVNGESTSGRLPYRHDEPPAPQDAYGISKHEAEQALWEVARTTGIEAVVVRPPLVYGPGVKANFQSLMQAVACGVPLPFGLSNNCRSMVYLGNLVDLLQRCATDPRAPGNIFLAGDGSDMSTGELVRQLAHAVQRRPRLLPVPPSLMRIVARILGKSAVAERVLGSLQVDIRHTCTTLDWQPPFSVAQGLQETVAPLLGSPRV